MATRFANCATCGQEISTDPDSAHPIAGRIKDRPYCNGCLEIPWSGVSGLAGGLATNKGDPSPWGENNTKAMEDG